MKRECSKEILDRTCFGYILIGNRLTFDPANRIPSDKELFAMSFLGDLFGGARPDMRLPGYAEGMINKIDTNVNPGMSFAGKQYKKIAKGYNEDPMSLASVSQTQGAGDLRDFDESGMQGANQLLAAGGGEQGLALANARSVGRERIKERTGLNSINEANSKYFGALEGQQAASNAKQQQILAKYGLMSGLLNTGYDATRKGGLFSADTIGKSMAAFAGGAGSALFRPKPSAPPPT